MDVIKKISELKKLLDAGILTKEEYENKKEQIIKDLQSAQSEDLIIEDRQDESKSSEVEVHRPNNMPENNGTDKVELNNGAKSDKDSSSVISSKTFIWGIVLLCLLISASILLVQHYPWHDDGDSYTTDSSQETRQKDTFLSPDLVIAGVRGHVKSIKSEQGNYEFSEYGEIQQWYSEWFDNLVEESELEREIDRDNDGFVSHFYYSTIGGEQLVFDKPNGRLISIESYVDTGQSEMKTFVYDENGNIIRESIVHVEPSDEYDEYGEVAYYDTTYYAHYIVVLEKDDNDNWIKRKYDDKVQTRVIEYYQ